MLDELEKILVLDLEFTCWMGRPPEGMQQEIIEIGIAEVCLMDKKITNTKRILVKPENSKVSRFCTKLTGIKQSHLNKKGISLVDANKILINEYNSKDLFWSSWGSYDKKHYNKECKNKEIEYPFSLDYIDLQKKYSENLGIKRLFGVENALFDLNLKFEGTPHSALDDAYNTARILLNMI